MQSLRDLQMLAEAEFSIEQTRKDLNRAVEFFRGKPWHTDWINAVGKVRHLSPEILEKQKCFAVPEDLLVEDIPEEFRHDSLGIVINKHIFMQGRFVYPVMDVRGDVMGYCGWDKDVKPKYLDSRNFGYKAKDTTLYGMEELPTYYSNDKPVYLVEGIVCCLVLRSMGLQALALLGSSISKYVRVILKRFGNRLCVIPDNDSIGKAPEDLTDNISGEHLVSLVKRTLTKALVVQSLIAKDIDDSVRLDEGKYTEQLIKELKDIMVCPLIPTKVIRIR